jgi:hypothetical protein
MDAFGIRFIGNSEFLGSFICPECKEESEPQVLIVNKLGLFVRKLPREGLRTNGSE